MEIKNIITEEDRIKNIYWLCKTIVVQQKHVLDVLKVNFPDMYQENRQVLSSNTEQITKQTQKIKEIAGTIKISELEPNFITIDSEKPISDTLTKLISSQELFGKLKHYLRSFTKQEAELEDLVWDVIVKIYEKRHEYNASKWAASTRIYKVAYNMAIDYSRKPTYIIQEKPASTKDITEEERLDWININREAHQSESKSAAESKKKFFRTINSLLKTVLNQEEASLLLSLAKWEKYEEIADRLELPLWTVKGQIFRAREKIRPYFERSKSILTE